MSEKFKETFKAVLLAVAVVLFLPLVIICGIFICRRSSGSGSDDGSADSFDRFTNAKGISARVNSQVKYMIERAFKKTLRNS